MLRLAIVVSCAVAFPLPHASAQHTPGQVGQKARRYLFDDYKNVVAIDLAAMRESGVWEDFEATLLKLAMKEFEEELGQPLLAIDRFVSVMELQDGHAKAIYVLEGNRELVWPKWTESEWIKTSQVGGAEARGYSDVGGDVWMRPEATILLGGDRAALEASVVGKGRGGLPSPDVMSLLAGRARTLAWAVADLSFDHAHTWVAEAFFDDEQWPAGQAPTFFALRLLTEGDADDPRLVLHAAFRHGADERGAAWTKQAVEKMIERVRTEPKLVLLRPLLRKVEHGFDRGDYVVRVDAGRPRDAIGVLAALAGPLFMLRSEPAVQVIEVEAAVEQAPPPPPPPPPAPQRRNG
jgi:hypothetical protein